MNKEGKYFDGWEDANNDWVKDAKWSDTQPTTGECVFISDDDGQFLIKWLSYGTYTLKEIEAPEGYHLLTLTQNFEISKDTYSGRFSTITNTKKSTIPLTGSTQLIVTVLARAVLIVLSGVYYRKYKIN